MTARPGKIVGLLMFGLLAAACDSGSSGKDAVSAAAPTVNVEEQAVGVTGIPIDPDKKTVVIVTPPGSGTTPEQQLERMQAQNAKTEAQIQARMKNYGSSINDTSSKERIAAEMTTDMAAYKKQSLEMYKLQQQMPETPPEAAE